MTHHDTLRRLRARLVLREAEISAEADRHWCAHDDDRASVCETEAQEIRDEIAALDAQMREPVTIRDKRQLAIVWRAPLPVMALREGAR